MRTICTKQNRQDRPQRNTQRPKRPAGTIAGGRGSESREKEPRVSARGWVHRKSDPQWAGKRPDGAEAGWTHPLAHAGGSFCGSRYERSRPQDSPGTQRTRKPDRTGQAFDPACGTSNCQRAAFRFLTSAAAASDRRATGGSRVGRSFEGMGGASGKGTAAGGGSTITQREHRRSRLEEKTSLAAGRTRTGNQTARDFFVSVYFFMCSSS